MLKDNLVVLTEEEYEALEARKQVPAEVIAEARRWAQNLRQWRRTATPTEDGFRLITEDCLRRCSAAFDALLAAVEAAPALEARKPQVPAEVIELVREGINEVFAAMDEVPLSGRMSDQRQEVDRKALAGLRLAVQAHTTCVKDLLAAVEAAPDAKHRFAEWCGENFAAIWYEFSLLRDELGLPQPECDEEASGSDPAPAPDFETMSADELRDWLDERGRLYEGRATGEEVLFHAWFGGGGAVGAGSGRTREAALLALCQKVAAEEAS